MCCVRLPVWTISAAADITNPLLTPLDPPPPPRACGRLIGTYNTRMQYQILFRPRQTRRSSPANGATRDVAQRRWLRSLRFTRAGSARGRLLLLLLLQIALLLLPASAPAPSHAPSSQLSLLQCRLDYLMQQQQQQQAC